MLVETALGDIEKCVFVFCACDNVALCADECVGCDRVCVDFVVCVDVCHERVVCKELGIELVDCVELWIIFVEFGEEFAVSVEFVIVYVVWAAFSTENVVNKELCPPDAAGVEFGKEVVDDVVLFLVFEMGELPELE